MPTTTTSAEIDIDSSHHVRLGLSINASEQATSLGAVWELTRGLCRVSIARLGTRGRAGAVRVGSVDGRPSLNETYRVDSGDVVTITESLLWIVAAYLACGVGTGKVFHDFFRRIETDYGNEIAKQIKRILHQEDVTPKRFMWKAIAIWPLLMWWAHRGHRD